MNSLTLSLDDLKPPVFVYYVSSSKSFLQVVRMPTCRLWPPSEANVVDSSELYHVDDCLEYLLCEQQEMNKFFSSGTRKEAPPAAGRHWMIDIGDVKRLIVTAMFFSQQGHRQVLRNFSLSSLVQFFFYL